MSTEGKSPLDHRAEPSDAARAARFAAIARRAGEGPGAKEMALTRKPRDEDAASTAKRMLDVQRRGEG